MAETLSTQVSNCDQSNAAWKTDSVPFMIEAGLWHCLYVFGAQFPCLKLCGLDTTLWALVMNGNSGPSSISVHHPSIRPSIHHLHRHSSTHMLEYVYLFFCPSIISSSIHTWIIHPSTHLSFRPSIHGIANLCLYDKYHKSVWIFVILLKVTRDNSLVSPRWKWPYPEPPNS